MVAFHAAQQTVTLVSGRLALCPSANKAGGLFKRDFCLVAAAGGEETGKLVRSEKEERHGKQPCLSCELNAPKPRAFFLSFWEEETYWEASAS